MGIKNPFLYSLYHFTGMKSISMKEFNKKNYDIDYRKKYKSQFNVDLNKDEKNELDNLLNKKGITKSEFLRIAISLLKEGKLDSYFEKSTK